MCRIFTRAVLVVLLPLLASQLLAGEQEIACVQMGELLPEHQGFLLTATGKPCFILRSGQEGEVSPPSAQKTAIFWPVLLRDILSAGSSVPGLPEARFLPVSGAYLLSKNDLLTPVDVPPLDVPPLDVPPLDLPPLDLPPLDLPPLDLPPLDLPPLPASRPDTSELARYLIPADADLAQKTELELQLKQLQATEQFLLSQSASSAVHELFRIYLTQAEGQLRVLVLTPVAVHQQQAIADRLAFTLLNAWLAWLEETEKQLYQPLQMAACGDGGDGDDPDATPLSIYFPDSSGPEFFQPLLLDKRLHKKLLRLQIVLAKLRWARACGNTELTKILDNRVMVLVADINDMGKLMTQSLGINGALGGALGEQSNPGADMELLADELTGYSLHPELIAEPVDSDNNPGSGKTAGKNGKASKASPVCTTRLVIFWDKNRKGAKGSGSGQPQSDRLCQHCLQHIAEHRVLTVTEKQVTVLQLCTYCFAQYSKNKKEVWVEPITCDGDPGNTPPSGKTMIKPADNNQLSDKIKDKDSGLISLLNEIFKPANRNSKPDSIWPPAEENSGSQENQNADNSIEVSNLDTVSKDKKEGSPDPGNSDEYVSNGGRGNRADNQDNVPFGIIRCARAVLCNQYEFNSAVDIIDNFAISASRFSQERTNSSDLPNNRNDHKASEGQSPGSGSLSPESAGGKNLQVSGGRKSKNIKFEQTPSFGTGRTVITAEITAEITAKSCQSDNLSGQQSSDPRKDFLGPSSPDKHSSSSAGKVSELAFAAENPARASLSVDENSGFEQPDPVTKVANVAKKEPTEVIGYEVLKNMTNNWNNKTRDHGGRLIAAGSFGEVFWAKTKIGSTEGQKEVAIKRLKKAKNERPSTKRLSTQQFNNEIQALFRANHPNIVRLLGISHDGPELCLIFEFINGGTLAQAVLKESANPPVWNIRISILQQIISALAHIHGLRPNCIIHRDVKPGNILLTSGSPRRAILADFGLSTTGEYEDDPEREFEESGSITVGTRCYMSPEAFKGQFSPKTDIFSFGVVILELVTGLPPYSTAKKQNLDLFLKQIESEGTELVAMADPRAKWPDTVAQPLIKLARCLTESDSGKRKSTQTVLGELNTLEQEAQKIGKTDK